LEQPTSLVISDAKTTGVDCTQLVKAKFIACQEWADPFFAGSSTEKSNDRHPIRLTFLEHDVIHHGEGAHSLRHLLRGGNVVIVKPNPARKVTKDKSRQTEQSKKEEADDAARAKNYKGLMWGESIQKLKELREKAGGPCPYGTLFEEDAPFDREKMRSTYHEKITRIEHTNAQFYQIPAGEQGLEEFESQMREECRFASLLETAREYPAMLLEVAGKLGVATKPLQDLRKSLIEEVAESDEAKLRVKTLEIQLVGLIQKAKNDCDLIVWHRRLEASDQNRLITKVQHESCQTGALQALGGPTNSARVLHLGDSKCKQDDNAFDVKGSVKNLFDMHFAGEKRNRTIFEQWVFMRAVVQLTGAKLLVSERTGLSDLFALAGGIPICQFVPMTRDKNPRLQQVYESGCGMGSATWFEGNLNKDTPLMKAVCVKAIKEKKELCEAICQSQSEKISVTKKCSSSKRF
jgi:hypothetical protein